ncbi:MAG: hypothetical protein L0099_02545, partial [Acidobacteria bacterium]|nr:hypothetical protein [Acidobacteriota bacterium]
MRLHRPLLCALILASGAYAQDPATGFPPYGSFQDGAFDAVNRQNLNTNLRISIGSFPGRGTDFSYALIYDSLVWKKSTSGAYWLINSSGGWKTDSGVGLLTWDTSNGTCVVDIGWTSTWTRYYNYKYKDTAGTTHSFNVSLYESEDCTTGSSTAPTAYATDGSGYYLDANDPTAPAVYSTAGVKVSGTGVLTDTNGNLISQVFISGYETHWKDTRGQIVLKVITSNPFAYKEYRVLQQDGTYASTRLNYTYTAVKSNFACSGVTEYTGNWWLPTSVDLPNQQSYTFTYEDTPGFAGYKTGRLKRVTLPTGGYYEYSYPTTGNKGINCTDATHTSLTRVINDGTTSATWTYARAQSGSNWNTTVTAPLLPYDAAANQSVFTFNSSGQLTAQKFYQGSSTVPANLRRTINTTWAANATPATTTTILE